jgi:hypothetical protein
MISALLHISRAYGSGSLTQVEALHEVLRVRPDLSATAAVYILDDPFLAVRR